MKEVTVVKVLNLPSGYRLGLSRRQAEARAHNLLSTEQDDVYLTCGDVCFIRGEHLLMDRDQLKQSAPVLSGVIEFYDCPNMDGLEPDDEPRKEPEKEPAPKRKRSRRVKKEDGTE